MGVRDAVKARARLQSVAKIRLTLAGRCDFLPATEKAFRAGLEELDIVGLDAVMLSTLLLRSMPLPGNLPIIADTHNVEFDVCRRMSQESDGWLRRTYFRRQWRFTYAEEKRCSDRVDLLLATSARDGKLFQTDFVSIEWRQFPMESIPSSSPHPTDLASLVEFSSPA